MIAAVETIQARFSALLGDPAVSAEPAACHAFAVDGVEPKLVIYPVSAEQVAAALKGASDLGLAFIPVRNGTKLDTGNPPRRYDVAISLKNLNRVWHYEPADLTVVVEAGMKLGDFEHFLERDGLWLPLDPRGGGRASVGGILATNSAGPLRGRFGAPRDMALGMKIATTEGKLIKTGGRVVKNVAGYDLGKLVIGSWGTLGIIVEASFKLFTRPAGRATFVFSLPTLDAARDLRRALFASPLEPLRMALLDRAAMQSVLGQGREREAGNSKPENRSPDFELWLEAGGCENVLARYSRELENLARSGGMNLERMDGPVAAWDSVADIASIMAAQSSTSVVLRAALPLDLGEEFGREALAQSKVRALILQPGTGVVTVVLARDSEGGVIAPATSELSAVVKKLREAAEKLGGALVVEHAPLELKAQIDTWGSAVNDVEIMRRVKNVWDPNETLSPGRFAGGI